MNKNNLFILESTKYFSALETQDESDKESLNENKDENSVEQNYYSPLIRNQMNSLEEYSSL